MGSLSPTDARPFHRDAWLCASIALAGLISTIGLFAHVPGFNGPEYMFWLWQRLPLRPSAGIGFLILLQLALTCWAVKDGRPVWKALLVLAVGGVALRVGICLLYSDPPGLGYAELTIRDPYIGSYHTFARALHGGPWTFADFPVLMTLPDTPLHVVNKPPGPTMFWYALIGVFGDSRMTILVGVGLMAALGALALPVMLWATRLAGFSAQAAVQAGALLMLAPGVNLFFPMFDPGYTPVVLAVMALWWQTLRSDSMSWAIVFGAASAGLMFVSFHVAPLIVAGLLVSPMIVRSSTSSTVLRKVLLLGVAGFTLLVVVALFDVIVGYNAIDTLRTAIEAQRLIMERFSRDMRPWPRSIGWDLSDAALGVGYVPVVIVLWLLVSPRGERSGWWFALAGLSTWVAIALTGLLPGETMRVWNFLFPLLLIPAGVELARASHRTRLVTYAVLALVLFAACCSLAVVAVTEVVH
jgi:hypothetical protein